jgi:hypothetical protein
MTTRRRMLTECTDDGELIYCRRVLSRFLLYGIRLLAQYVGVEFGENRTAFENRSASELSHALTMLELPGTEDCRRLRRVQVGVG